MNRKEIAKIIYYELIPVIIGFFLFGYLGRVTDVTDLIHKMIIFLIYMTPFSIVYMWIGGFIFSRLFPRDTYAYRLMAKMTKCKTRKENGVEYCAKCPESLVCINSIDNMNKADKIKGDIAK
jgi:hypothetical protein